MTKCLCKVCDRYTVKTSLLKSCMLDYQVMFWAIGQSSRDTLHDSGREQLKDVVLEYDSR